MQAIDNRYSVRAYLDKEVEEAKLQAILQAGRKAPSARNRQEWHFYVVTNKEIKREIMVISGDQEMIDQAPVCIVVTATDQYMMRCKVPAYVVDPTLALSFIMLEAQEQGLGTCWIGSFDQDKLKELLSLPEGETVIGLTPLGYGNNGTIERQRKALEDIVTYIK